MLNDNDLEKIAGVIEKRLEPRFESIDKRFDGLENRMGGLENSIGEMKKRMDLQEKELKKVNKTLKDTISFFDHRDIDMSMRVDRVEQHLGLSVN